jgi:hypothetical protein
VEVLEGRGRNENRREQLRLCFCNTKHGSQIEAWLDRTVVLVKSCTYASCKCAAAIEVLSEFGVEFLVCNLKVLPNRAVSKTD